MTSGAESVGVILAFNTIGWKPSNVLFMAVDALLGDPLISTAFGGAQPAMTIAYIRDTPVVAAGSIHVGAVNGASITAEISNNATSAPGAIMGAGGMAAAFVLASNMVSSGAEAWIDFTVGGAVSAGSDVEVAASDEAGITATTALDAEVSPTNDAGAGIMNGFVGAFLDDYEYTSHSGTQTVVFGDRVEPTTAPSISTWVSARRLSSMRRSRTTRTTATGGRSAKRAC